MKFSLQYIIPATATLLAVLLLHQVLHNFGWTGVFLISACTCLLCFGSWALWMKLKRPALPAGRFIESQNFESLVSAIEDYAIFLVDKGGLVLSWNSGAARIKGFLASDIIGRSTELFYNEPDRQAGLPGSNIQQALVDGRMQTEGWRVRKDGSTFFADVVITALFDKDDQHYGFAIVTKDISKHKTAETKMRSRNTSLAQTVLAKTRVLLESEKKYRYLFENNPVAMYVAALDNFAILDVNERAIIHYGFTKEEFLGMTSLDL